MINTLNKKTQKGFTLIEVLVVVAVVGIMMTLASAIFINTIRNSKKSEITAEARENAALVIDSMQRDGRLAENFSFAATSLTMNNTPSGPIVWSCHQPPGANGYVTRRVGLGGPVITVTNRDLVEGISVESCSIVTNGNNNQSAKIVFTVKEGKGIGTGPQEYGVNFTFNTSVTARKN